MANDHIFALIDCNNFYASCERVFNPSLNNKPVVILSNNDGCVIARSQEAKDLGIEMATPAYKNKALFTKHNVNLFSSNYALYGDLSARVMDVISNFSPDIEIYSIDESFIELSGFKNRDLTEYGREIKATVEKWTGIPVSVGIAKTKTLAKIANHIAKKKKYYKGVFNLLDIEDINQVLVQVPVSKIWGIGRQYSHFLNKNNIVTALDLIQANDEWISKYLTSLGHQTVLELKGTSCIDMNSIDPPKKGIVSSKSFGKAVNTLSELEEAVSTYINIACNKLRKQHSVAQYISVYISTNRFKDTPQYNNNASIRFLSPTAYTPDFIQASLVILKR
ncbi:MAG: protein umuC, partial [Candidatus Cloacimonetes bacterium 4572_65]